MNWFQQNRFLGTFLLVFGLATLAALFFLWTTRSGFNEAKARFDENASELNRLQRLTPFPSESNLKKMRSQAEDYRGQLNKLKEDLKGRVLPVVPLAPNEFQSRLRQATAALADKARANRVKLPDNFYLGFEEFAASLPDTAAAPLLGQQLAQAEMLVNILLDSRVDALTSFRRVPAAEASLASAIATPTPAAARRPPAAQAPAAAAPLVERTVVEASFLSSPGAARRVINQVATANQQFYVIRTLHVLNEKDKGPPREGAGAPAASTPPPSAPGGAAPALNFIVGNERIQVTARIEMLRFSF